MVICELHGYWQVRSHGGCLVRFGPRGYGKLSKAMVVTKMLLKVRIGWGAITTCGTGKDAYIFVKNFAVRVC